MLIRNRFHLLLWLGVSLGLICGCGGGSSTTSQRSGSPTPTPIPTPTPTPTPAPTPSPTPTPQAHSVSISWQPSSSPGIVSYNVYRSLQSGGPYSKVGSVAATTFTDNNVQPGATYFYVISAVNSSDVESPASSPEVNVTVPK